MFSFFGLRRISCSEDLPMDCSGMKLTGIVTSVPDGDGFRFFHTPLLRSDNYTREDQKLSIRLAGIDAPEMQGKTPGQPFAEESKQYLANLILKKKVELKVVGKDRYNRVLAFATLKGWVYHTDINVEMVKKGLACVYVGQDAKYDGRLEELKKHEEEAKRKKRGMWKLKNTVTPMEHKKMHRSKALKTTSSSSILGQLWNYFWGK